LIGIIDNESERRHIFEVTSDTLYVSTVIIPKCLLVIGTLVEHCSFFGDEKTIEEVELIEFKTFDESKFLERRRFLFCFDRNQ
jgi:hypothetical protein